MNPSYIRVAWEAEFTVRGMLSEDKIEVKFYKWSRGIFYAGQGEAWNKSKPMAQSTSKWGGHLSLIPCLNSDGHLPSTLPFLHLHLHLLCI